MRQLQHGDRNGTAWRPGETDVSIRPGWFHHAAENALVRSVTNLVDLHFTSVGRNSKLLLNVPPTRNGVLHETDVSRLEGMHSALTTMFADDLANGKALTWQTAGDRAAIAGIELGRIVTAGIVELREDITRGQRVARYSVEGRTGNDWRTLSGGTTIGHCKLDRIEPGRVQALRVRIEDTTDTPLPLRIGLYGP
jgi:alpha-L-fucosidase